MQAVPIIYFGLEFHNSSRYFDVRNDFHDRSCSGLFFL